MLKASSEWTDNIKIEPVKHVSRETDKYYVESRNFIFRTCTVIFMTIEKIVANDVRKVKHKACLFLTMELSKKFKSQCHSELLRHIRTHLLRMWIRNLCTAYGVDAEIGCKQPRSA